MAIADIRKLIGVGVPPETAKVIDEIITASGASIAWADVTGTQAGVEAAVAAKTEIAALTGSSTAADIVAALQA
jgi:hypothetical protein